MPFVSQRAAVTSFFAALAFGLWIGFGMPKPPTTRIPPLPDQVCSAWSNSTCPASSSTKPYVNVKDLKMQLIPLELNYSLKFYFSSRCTDLMNIFTYSKYLIYGTPLLDSPSPSYWVPSLACGILKRRKWMKCFSALHFEGWLMLPRINHRQCQIITRTKVISQLK